MKSKRSVLLVALVMLLSMTALVAAVSADTSRTPRVVYWLTVLHNNDGESQVVNAGGDRTDFGGAAGFKTVVDNLRDEARSRSGTEPGGRRGVVMISSGDNFLAGPEFTVGAENGIPFYDTIAMELIGYDAVALGNHDFDFGPGVLADFIEGYDNPPPYVSANLDFSAEPRLQAFVDEGVISSSQMINDRGKRIGVIGLETPNLPFISSPGNVVVSDDLVFYVQNAVNRFKDRNVDIVIIASHLQNIDNEIELVSQIKDVDIVIGGGGDELLANPGDLLLPGDEGSIAGPYPLLATDSTGRTVPVVTTTGEYRYVGKLVVGFDRRGNIVVIDDGRSGPVRVATGDCNGTLPCDDAVEPDPTMQAMVVDPVVAGLQIFEETVIGQSEVDLDGTRASVRSVESNQGNLIADSLLWQATENAPAFGANVPDVALQNGGGIRNDSVIPAGDITALDTFDMLPFLNFVSVVEDVPREQFKEIMENAVACTQSNDFAVNANCGSGRFAQIAGFSFEWDAAGTGLILDDDTVATTPGTRVVSIVLDDGTVIVENGNVVPGDPINVATIDFSARGGDQYPYRGLPFKNIGATYQQALQNYIVDGLSGTITAAEYPEGGEGRITLVP